MSTAFTTKKSWITPAGGFAIHTSESKCLMSTTQHEDHLQSLQGDHLALAWHPKCCCMLIHLAYIWRTTMFTRRLTRHLTCSRNNTQHQNYGLLFKRSEMHLGQPSSTGLMLANMWAYVCIHPSISQKTMRYCMLTSEWRVILKQITLLQGISHYSVQCNIYTSELVSLGAMSRSRSCCRSLIALNIWCSLALNSHTDICENHSHSLSALTIAHESTVVHTYRFGLIAPYHAE